MHSTATFLASRNCKFSVLISGWQLLYHWRLPYFIQRNIRRSTERPEKWVCCLQSSKWNQLCCSELRGKMRLYPETRLIYDSQTTYWKCPVTQEAQVGASRTGATVWVRNSPQRQMNLEATASLPSSSNSSVEPNCLIGGRGSQGKCRQADCGRQTMEDHFGDNGSRLSVYESFSHRHTDKHIPPATRVHFTGVPAAARSLFANILFSCARLSREKREFKHLNKQAQAGTEEEM